MDIDSPPSDTYTNDPHTLTLPPLSASFPLPFRVFFLIGLVQLLWAINLHILHLLGLNTSWILDFRDEPDVTELELTSTSREIIRPESGKLYQPVYKLFLLYTFWVGGGWAIFTLLTGSDTESMEKYRAIVAIITAGIVGGIVIPWRGVGERERRGFRRWAIKRIILPSPTLPIFFSDVILADILTSLAKVLGDLWISTCQIWLGGITQGRKAQSGWSSWVILVMTCLPYLIRFRQCLLEFHQSGYKSPRPMMNACKYFSAFPVIFLSAAQKTVAIEVASSKGISVQELGATGDRWHGEHPLFRLWLLAVVVNSMFSFYWDVKMDWGLALCDMETWSLNKSKQSILSRFTGWLKPPAVLHQRSPGPAPNGLTMTSPPSILTSILTFGLRPTLLLPDPLVYHIFTLIDFVLRFTWSLKLSSHLHTISEIESGVFMMEALELLRRWGWVFIRVEWEAVKMGQMKKAESEVLWEGDGI